MFLLQHLRSILNLWPTTPLRTRNMTLGIMAALARSDMNSSCSGLRSAVRPSVVLAPVTFLTVELETKVRIGVGFHI